MEAMGMQGVESKVEVAPLPPPPTKLENVGVTSPDISRFLSCFERFKAILNSFPFPYTTNFV